MSDKKSTGSHSIRTRSQVVGSRSSRRSTTSAAAALARAEAEATKAEAAFLEKENQIKMDQARFEVSLKVEATRLEISLDSLKVEKKAAVAVAKAEALEVVYEEQSEEDVRSKINLQNDDPAKHTKAYVEEQAKHAAIPLLPAFEEAPNDNVAQHAPKVTIQDHKRDDKPSRDHQPQVHSY